MKTTNNKTEQKEQGMQVPARTLFRWKCEAEGIVLTERAFELFEQWLTEPVELRAGIMFRDYLLERINA